MNAAFRAAAAALLPEPEVELSPPMSLRAYVEAAWHVVEPSTTYRGNWHIDAIAEHLEAVTFGDIENLLINIPPRHMKSLLTSVFWPTWVWTFRPSSRWLFASYAQGLSTRDSLKCRRVIESRWYQSEFGDVFQLTGDQNQKTRFENDRGGYRIATSVGGSATGEGGDFRVIDDPHNVNKADSANDLDAKRDWFDQVWSSRYNEPGDPQVVNMQRVNERDISARCIELGWTHLCLPAEYEPSRRCVTVPLPSTGGEPFADPRTEPGQLLWPERFDAAHQAKTKRDLGAFGYAGQQQQRPSPGEGGTWKRHWWRYWQPRGVTMPPVRVELPGGETMAIEAVELPAISETLHSWDMTFKETTSGSYVVGQVWGCGMAHKFLLDQVRDRMEFTAAQAAVITLDAKWPGATKLIEDKANGPAIISALSGVVSRLIAESPEGSKTERAASVAPDIEAGDVFLPHPDLPGFGWVRDFIEECAAFPRGANDDQVDAASQALKRMRASNVGVAAPLHLGSHSNPYAMQ